MTEIDFRNFSSSKLAEIVDRMNQWEWPEEIGPEPTGWYFMSLSQKYKIIFPILKKMKTS